MAPEVSELAADLPGWALRRRYRVTINPLLRTRFWSDEEREASPRQ